MLVWSCVSCVSRARVIQCLYSSRAVCARVLVRSYARVAGVPRGGAHCSHSAPCPPGPPGLQSQVEMSRTPGDRVLVRDDATARVVGSDRMGKVNEWNRKAVGITGYPKEEVVGRSRVPDFITPDFQASVK